MEDFEYFVFDSLQIQDQSEWIIFHFWFWFIYFLNLISKKERKKTIKASSCLLTSSPEGIGSLLGNSTLLGCPETIATFGLLRLPILFKVEIFLELK